MCSPTKTLLTSIKPTEEDLSMKIIGKDIETYLDSIESASLLARDNNDYLISYRLKSGIDVAFDPRTKTQASLFVGALPECLNSISGLGDIKKYPPKNPSSALKRVSTQLNNLSHKYKIEVHTIEALSAVIESQLKA